MAALIEVGEDPQDWQDIALAHGNWTWHDIRDAPDWAIARANLWTDAIEQVRKNKAAENE